MPDDLRRQRVWYLDPQALLALCNGVPLRLISQPPLPPDAQVRSITTDWARNRFGLLIESAEYATVPPGEMPPEMTTVVYHLRTPRTVVCLCGSTRFWRTFQQAGLAETMAGRIVLSIGAASGTDDEHFGNLPPAEYDRIKGDLDALHMDKIAMADEVLILNENDYIGESTRRELAYARELGLRVRWWNWPSFHARDGEVAGR